MVVIANGGGTNAILGEEVSLSTEPDAGEFIALGEDEEETGGGGSGWRQESISGGGEVTIKEGFVLPPRKFSRWRQSASRPGGAGGKIEASTEEVKEVCSGK